MQDTLKRIGLVLIVVMILSMASVFVSIVLALGGSSVDMSSGSVARIPISGVIAYGSNPWDATADPAQVTQWIKDAEEDEQVRIIVLDIDSPGGSAVASDEIAQAVKNSSKPVVAFIRESGASGAYWIASSADHIIAQRLAITGSVGVTASYIEFGGTLNRYNATYQQFTGGEYKEVATPFQAPTAEERALFQKKIDMVHAVFVEEVQANRNLTLQNLERVETGEFFLGIEALELGLVDELGGEAELEAKLTEMLGDNPTYKNYRKPTSLFQDLGLTLALPQMLPSVEGATRVSVRT